MASKSITATEAARNFSDVLNQVRYQGAEFDIVRGKEVMARIVPAAPSRGVPISQLNALVRAWPRLGTREAGKLRQGYRARLGTHSPGRSGIGIDRRHGCSDSSACQAAKSKYHAPHSQLLIAH